MLRILEGTRLAPPLSVATMTLAVAAAGVAAAGPQKSHPPAKTPKAPSLHGHTIYQSPQLWATIDVCSTSAHPHMVGIRGSMPGSGLAGESMYMRFQIQYEDTSARWRSVGQGGDSGFLAVGSSTFKARQAGRTFTLDVTPGSHYIVRGVVTFEWRRKGHVVRNAQKPTSPGHSAVAGADPPGYSAAACELA
jgi:hypothetical protein